MKEFFKRLFVVMARTAIVAAVSYLLYGDHEALFRNRYSYMSPFEWLDPPRKRKRAFPYGPHYYSHDGY